MPRKPQRSSLKRRPDPEAVYPITLPREHWGALLAELERLPLEIAKRSAAALRLAGPGDPLTVSLDQAAWSRLLSAVLPHDAGKKSPGSDRGCELTGAIYKALTPQLRGRL